MGESQWGAWVAVKAIGEAVVRGKSHDVVEIAGYLRGERARIDGSKGPGMGFRPWNGQLRQAINRALTDKPRTLGIWVVGFEATIAEQLTQSLLLALAAAEFSMPRFRRETAKPGRLPLVKLLGQSPRLDLERVQAEAEAVNLTRWLTALPPNRLDAAGYTEAVRVMAEANGWGLKVLDEKRLRKLGAGAFLAVAQGNASRDACILHLAYRPGAKKASPALALVGKGIVFDTGGNNLKPFKSMLDMHEDMAGSAVALATLLALTRLEYPHPVDCWLAVTENRLSAAAYKSRDVVTAANGLTIEVIHTDAEGRMVLADALALAGNEGPAVIMDFATLTGSCVHALTERYSGVFTNRESLAGPLIEVGRACGERVWPFPLDGDFDEEIESKVADVAQCSPGAGADQILAARFLRRFVPETSAWIHMDLKVWPWPGTRRPHGIRRALFPEFTVGPCRSTAGSKGEAMTSSMEEALAGGLESRMMSQRFRGFLPVVVDLETGGFDAETDALLEIAAVLLRLEATGELCRGETFRFHVEPFPGANLEAASLEVNGIDPFHPLRPAIAERDALQRIFREVRREMREMDCSRAILVGHNAQFDLGFLNKAVERCGLKRNPFHPFSIFDTATLSGVALGQTVLARAVTAAGLDWDSNAAHSAAYDAEVTADLFCEIVNRFRPAYEESLARKPGAANQLSPDNSS